MADLKISQLSAATTPLAGTEVVPIVQSGTTKKVAISDLTAGRAVSGASFAVTGSSVPTNGIYLPASNELGFAVNSTYAGRFDANRNLLIGRTTRLNAGDVDSIQVMSDTSQIVIFNTTAGSGQSYNFLMSQFGTFFVQNASGAGVYLTYGATSWTSTSDLRKKNVTGKIEDALTKINSLTPARFTWKSDKTNKPQVGLIAQEVQAVLPEVVTDDGEGTLGVRYAETVPLLVAAIQELSGRVTALESAK